MHRGGRGSLAGMDWSGSRTTGSYSDSKLFVRTLAAAVARLWEDVFSNAVDPGWVPTKRGGAGAPDDLRLGHLTQEWLATSDDPEALTSGGYWYITSAGASQHAASVTSASRTNCSRSWLASPARVLPDRWGRTVIAVLSGTQTVVSSNWSRSRTTTGVFGSGPKFARSGGPLGDQRTGFTDAPLGSRDEKTLRFAGLLQSG